MRTVSAAAQPSALDSDSAATSARPLLVDSGRVRSSVLDDAVQLSRSARRTERSPGPSPGTQSDRLQVAGMSRSSWRKGVAGRGRFLSIDSAGPGLRTAAVAPAAGEVRAQAVDVVGGPQALEPLGACS